VILASEHSSGFDLNGIIKELESTFMIVASERNEVLTCDDVLVFKYGNLSLVLAVVICVFPDAFVIGIISTGCVLDEGFGFHLNVVVFLLSTSYECKKYQY
tara:strand:- start:207 stop:509 length:303 start_codon:yes stop_codon:yes gene_type:complete